MRASPAYERPRRLGPLVRGVLLLAIATAGASRAEAGARHPSGGACGCETLCRGESCCCDHAPPADEGAPIAAPRYTGPGRVEPARPSGPCLGAIPCGGGDRPTIPVGAAAPKAMLPVATARPAAPVAGWVATRETGPIEPGHARRIDDPPEVA